MKWPGVRNSNKRLLFSSFAHSTLFPTLSTTSISASSSVTSAECACAIVSTKRSPLSAKAFSNVSVSV